MRCDDDQLADEADALVSKFATAPTQGLAETKRIMRSAFSRTLDEQLEIERDMMRKLGYSEDYSEGVDAFHE